MICRRVSVRPSTRVIVSLVALATALPIVSPIALAIALAIRIVCCLVLAICSWSMWKCGTLPHHHPHCPNRSGFVAARRLGHFYQNHPLRERASGSGLGLGSGLYLHPPPLLSLGCWFGLSTRLRPRARRARKDSASAPTSARSWAVWLVLGSSPARPSVLHRASAMLMGCS